MPKDGGQKERLSPKAEYEKMKRSATVISQGYTPEQIKDAKAHMSNPSLKQLEILKSLGLWH